MAQVGADVTKAVKAVKLVGKLFGMNVAALGIVDDLVSAIVDGLDAAQAFAKGGLWGNLDGAMDVVKAVASMAAVGAAMLMGVSNPVTQVFDAVLMGVVMLANFVDTFKPKPLTGPELVAVALTRMQPALCNYHPPSGCFPAHSTVLSGGQHVLISSLQLGSPVMSVAADGSVEEKSVHFFGHKVP